MKNSILKVLLCFIAILGITGCGDRNNNETKKDNNKLKNNLSQNVKIGDYVSYSTKSGNSYTAKKENTGYSNDQVFETTGEEKWRVLSVENDGTINLILDGYIGTKYDKPLYLKGKLGYDNAIEELNNISKIYGNGAHAKSSRALTENDLNNLIDLDTIVKHYQNEYEKDIDTTGTREETFDQIYKLVNKFYGIEKNIGNEKIKINSKFTWSSGMNSFGFETVVTDPVKLSILKSDAPNNVWLANQRISYSENPMMGWSGIDYEISYFYMNRFSAYNGASLSSVTASLDGTNINRTIDIEKNGYVRPVVSIDANTEYSSGDGSKEKPWILK